MDWGTSDWRSGGCHGLPNINEPQRSPSMPSPAMPRHMRPPGLILGHQVVRSWAKMGQDGPKCLEIFGDGSNKHYGTPKCWLFQQFQRLNLNNTQQTQWFRVLTALTVEPVPVFWLMIVHLCSGIQGFQKFLLLCCKYSHGSSHRANHQFMT